MEIEKEKSIEMDDKRMDVYEYEIQRAIKLVKDYQLRNKKRKSKGKQIWK